MDNRTRDCPAKRLVPTFLITGLIAGCLFIPFSIPQDVISILGGK